MKVTDTDSIRDLENELIDILTGELDWDVIEKILKEKYNLKLHDDVEYKKGDIVVHDHKVAYKLDFDVKVTLSLLFGRDGECYDITTSGDAGALPETLLKANGNAGSENSISPLDSRDLDNEKKEKLSKMASELAHMISGINTDTVD